MKELKDDKKLNFTEWVKVNTANHVAYMQWEEVTNL